MKLLKIGFMAVLAIASSAAFSQSTWVVGAGPEGGLRVGEYNGAAYARPFLDDTIGSVAPGNIITVGRFVDAGYFEVIVAGPRNSYYKWLFLRDNGQRLQIKRIASAIPGGRCVGVGDFNRDDNREFVIVSPDGKAFAYEIQRISGKYLGRISLGFAPSGEFDRVVGVADTNHDRNPDLVLQSSTTNRICYREYVGTVRGGVTDPVIDGSGEVIAPNGTVLGASNQSGGLQLHIRSAATGTMRVWGMNGRTRISNDQVGGWNAGWTFTMGSITTGP